MAQTTLTVMDVRSAAWQHVTSILGSRLAALRADLENPENTRDEDLLLKGRVAELKRTLALGDKPSAGVDGAPTFNDESEHPLPPHWGN